MAEIVTHEYRLEDIARDHAINAAVFVPFAILRLRGDREATDATFEVMIHDVREAGDKRGQLRLKWSAESAPAQPPAVHDRSVTEWAACGVACAIVSVFGGLRTERRRRRGSV